MTCRNPRRGLLIRAARSGVLEGLSRRGMKPARSRSSKTRAISPMSTNDWDPVSVASRRHDVAAARAVGRVGGGRDGGVAHLGGGRGGRGMVPADARRKQREPEGSAVRTRRTEPRRSAQRRVGGRRARGLARPGARRGGGPRAGVDRRGGAGGSGGGRVGRRPGGGGGVGRVHRLHAVRGGRSQRPASFLVGA